MESNKEKIKLKKAKIESPKPEYHADGGAETVQQYEKAKLWIDYNRAVKDKKYLPEFFSVSADVAGKSVYVKEYGALFTQHINELINTYTAKQEMEAARQVVEHFILQIFPSLNRAGYQEGVEKNIEIIASHSLALAIILQDVELQSWVLDNLLGRDFDVQALENATLVYNLACYYAVNQQKSQMLRASRRAMQLGKKPEQLSTEPDMKHYWDDVDFKHMLATHGDKSKSEHSLPDERVE